MISTSWFVRRERSLGSGLRWLGPSHVSGRAALGMAYSALSVCPFLHANRAARDPMVNVAVMKIAPVTPVILGVEAMIRHKIEAAQSPRRKDSSARVIVRSRS